MDATDPLANNLPMDALPVDSHDISDYFRLVLNSLLSGVLAVDKDGTILAANDAARRHLQLDSEVLAAGNQLTDLPISEPFLRLFEQAVHGGRSLAREEFVVPGSDGKDREIGVSVSLLEGLDGVNGAIFLFTDMTERRRIEREAALNRQLASIGELTAGVVHELRNPLSVISGMCELLLRRLEADHPGRKSAEAIGEETTKLQKLVAQFLGFARPFEVEPAWCHPQDILERVVKLCRRQADENGASIEVDYGPDLPKIHADLDKAAQAVANLVNNAVDAVGKGGRVHVGARSTGRSVVFRVRDNGPGVQCDPDENLFSPFVSKKEGGTGLGLAIVHRIVTAHGGAVSYRNLDEGGACFEVALPIEKGSRRA